MHHFASHVVVDNLDERICSIGDQTVVTEKKIRTIKGDSSLTLITEEDEGETSFSCIKVTWSDSYLI